MDSRNWEDNAVLVDEITEDILNRLNSAASSDFRNLIGMDFHKKRMHKLLDLKSNNEVRMIGIWGMGGTGKTTLAKYMFEDISRHFQARCFLEDVKKIYHDGGLSRLREELVSRIQGEDARNSYLGSDVIKERLGRRKVLLVIDDVDDVDQLYALAKEDRWFGLGSRVIVTTRDRHLLVPCGINHVYEVKCLADNEALRLFCRFAFKPPRKHPPDGFQSLSQRAVRIAGGLPLALRVFGSYLCGRKDKGFWEDAFDRLEESLDVEKVTKILKISYDGLSKGHRDIFLYVACFYNGVVKSGDHLADVLRDKGVKYGIEVLAEKSLISISEDGKILMHDLVKQMGREAGEQQFSDDPTKRMILWKPDDIDEVLNGDQVARAIKAISLDLDKIDEFNIEEEITKKVPNLNLLHIYSSSSRRGHGLNKPQIPYDPKINLPYKLRYLRWDYYSYRSLELHAKNLVKLELRHNKFEKLWDASLCLENLKEIDVSSSYHLKEFPDVSKAPNLEVITATRCVRFTELPQSICNLDKLTRLDLIDCERLQRLPDNMDMKSLKHVLLDRCHSLKIYPQYCRGVKHLSLSWIRESELPESICHLSYLERLTISDCKNLEHLPDTIGDLISLRYLMLRGCYKLRTIPETIGRLSCLESLYIGDCESLKHLPDTIGDLISIKSLRLHNYCKLQSIPETIYKLKSLGQFWLTDARQITTFPNFPESIRKLDFRGTLIEEIPSSIEDLHMLECLNVSESRRLKNLPRSIYKLECLKKLSLRDCPYLESFPSPICDTGICFEEHDAEMTDLIRLPQANLEELFISRPEKSDGTFLRLPPFSNFPSLKKLHLVNLSMLEISCDLGLLTDLEELDLSGNDFGVIPASINQLKKLSKLKINNCMRFYSLSELPQNIEEISATRCATLTKVSGIHKLKLTRMCFDFANCFKLNEETQWNIYEHMISKDGNGDIVQLPGNEVPSCFDQRNKGSYLTITLPHSSAITGFVACIVVEDNSKDALWIEWECEYTKGNCSTSVLRDLLNYEVEIQSGHMLFFNSDLTLEEDEKVVFDQISFEFFFSDIFSECPLLKVKECGVGLQFTPSSSRQHVMGAPLVELGNHWKADDNKTMEKGEEPSTKKQKLL